MNRRAATRRDGMGVGWVVIGLLLLMYAPGLIVFFLIAVIWKMARG